MSTQEYKGVTIKKMIHSKCKNINRDLLLEQLLISNYQNIWYH